MWRPVCRSVMRVAQVAIVTLPSDRHVLSRRLDAEWQHLRTHRPSLAAANSWDLRGLDRPIGDLDQILAATQRSTADSGDRLLAELVSLARHDELAGRLVLQRILPGLVVRSAPLWFLCDGADPLDLAAPAAWIAIRRFDVERRSHHVAVRLISDAVDIAFRQAQRRSNPSVATPPADFDAHPTATTRHAFDELAEVVRAARKGGVSDEHLDLLRHLVRAGSPGQVARERQVTPRTVRNHRDRAIRCVQQVVAA